MSFNKFWIFCLLGIFLSIGTVSSLDILGAGATFPLPLYTKMFNSYKQSTGIQVNYQGIGSGGGIRSLLDRTVDFGGTDAFMSEEEMSKAENNQILHIPTCLGAIVVTYNLPGNPTLKLTSEVVSDIFLGKITKWNDDKISQLNPGVELPDMDIIVVHRSDGSGSTFIFSDYLCKVSKEWEETVGRGKSLEWPTGLGASGNPGVAGLVKSTPGAVGYVELIYALSNDMPTAHIKNKSGNFIQPSIESVSASANVALPVDMRVSITNTDASNGYPISGFTWIILYQEQNYNNREKTRAEEVVNLIWWMIHDGQSHNTPLHYAPLPDEAVRNAEIILKSITYNGSPLL
ncbi:MAG: phosphate ABC transporter substrate-binding protein PstS [bacterium]